MPEETSCVPDICEVGGEGFLLPLFDSENSWPPGLRVVIYFVALLWFFLAVALISDVFMSAIERITSKKMHRLNAATGRYITSYVWNPTVANLTLMALGSSAPEILLSCIELLSGDMFAGPLGPSTIVGSAAFNLFMIIAVCMCALPAGEVRVIKDVPVYAITAVCSIFAYVWLLIILLASTPHVVDPVEGTITFLFFPVMIGAAYLADVGFFSPQKDDGSRNSQIRSIIAAGATKEEVAETEAHIRMSYGNNLTEEQFFKLLRIEAGEKHTRAQYRVAATRRLVGGRRVHLEEKMIPRSASPLNRLAGLSSMSIGKKNVVPVYAVEDPTVSYVYFDFPILKYAVLESAGTAVVSVRRSGREDCRARVGYRTREGTAKTGSDFTYAEGFLVFAPGETTHDVRIAIVDDTAYEEDEEFYLDLFNPSVEDDDGGWKGITPQLGHHKTATVVIIDDDCPGFITTTEDTVTIEEGTGADQEVEIVIQRKNGCTGKVTCRYTTEDDTAKSPDDYDELDGILELYPNETATSIKVNIKNRGRYDRTDRFRVILTDVTGGAKFDPETDGGADSCIVTVLIKSAEVAKDRIDRIMSKMQVTWGRAKLGNSNWRDQFVCAIYVNGGEQEEDDDNPSYIDYAMHGVLLPWKIFVAFCPPVDYCDGWLCFVCSLLMIGFVTAFIGDLAALLGCSIGLVTGFFPPEVTAITLVALGTSLPDTFASRTAAVQDPTADASIGNVTGSNSVNVFLGLGLPWTIGSYYWTSREPSQRWIDQYRFDSDLAESVRFDSRASFVVKAGTLAPSVGIFSACAFTCVSLLYFRRRMFGGELGGPMRFNYLTSIFLALLWLFYIILSSYFALSAKQSC